METIRTLAMESTAQVLCPDKTLKPIVRIRRYVPMNSPASCFPSSDAIIAE